MKEKENERIKGETSKRKNHSSSFSLVHDMHACSFLRIRFSVVCAPPTSRSPPRLSSLAPPRIQAAVVPAAVCTRGCIPLSYSLPLFDQSKFA